MSVERVQRQGGAVWRVRWREAGRQRSRVIGRKRDAEVFDAEVRRRQRLGEMGIDSVDETLDQYVTGTWAHVHAMHLAPKTRQVYAAAYDRHIEPRLGRLRLREINSESVARFQADLLASGVGPQAVRKSMNLLGGHGADLTMRVYGHVITELEDSPKLSAEDAIRAARATDVSVLCLAEQAT